MWCSRTMAWDPETTDSQDWAERGLRMAADTTAGTWIIEHVHNFDHTVVALVPPVFPRVRPDLPPREHH